jgi:hypothetical protein
MKVMKKRTEESVQAGKNQHSIERFAFFLTMSFLIIHVMTCLWVLIAKVNPNVSQDWIREGGFQGSSSQRIYIAACYYVTSTCTTVGYGDIHAFNTTE